MEQKLNPPGAKKHSDIVKIVLEKRALHEADKVNKARREVAAKEERFNASVARMKTPMIEIRRQKLREAKAAGKRADKSKKHEGDDEEEDHDRDAEEVSPQAGRQVSSSA